VVEEPAPTASCSAGWARKTKGAKDCGNKQQQTNKQANGVGQISVLYTLHLHYIQYVLDALKLKRSAK